MGVINEAEASPQLAQHSRLSPHRMTDTIMSVGSFSSFFLPSKMLNSTARATGISSMRMADGGSLRLTQFLRRITQCESRRVSSKRKTRRTHLSTKADIYRLNVA
jgi:hypothetical protein